LGRELFRGEHLQCQRVNLIANRRAERAVHQLMALHRTFAGEAGGYHHGLEMHVILALDQRTAASKTCLDELRYLLWIHTRSCNKSKLTLYHSRMIPDFTDDALVELGRQALTIEIDGLRAQVPRLGPEFARACRICLSCRGRIVVTGMGKSGHVGGKIAATLASTGTPAFFVHPGEASHGDVGMITRDDAVLALSNSGETDEIMTIVPVIARLGVPLIAFTGNSNSTLARLATVHLDIGVPAEACPLNLAPTASTTAALAVGDALAVALLKARGFTEEDFARSHPAGNLGRRLLLHVSDVMRSGADIPTVRADTPLAEGLLEVTRKGLGMTAIVDDSMRVLGVFTDGDLRRALDRAADLRTTRMDQVMSRHAKTVRPTTLAAEAVHLMETHSITSLVVVDAEDKIVGALNVHDLLRAGVV
jgi:arabinose-5-phosphate isomerase